MNTDTREMTSAARKSPSPRGNRAGTSGNRERDSRNPMPRLRKSMSRRGKSVSRLGKPTPRPWKSRRDLAIGANILEIGAEEVVWRRALALARDDRVERGDEIALAQRLLEQLQRAPDSVGGQILTVKAPKAGCIVDVLGSSRQH